MPRATSSPPPLDAAKLERLALRYVERYATTRARLAAYLKRKVATRGWSGEVPPDVDGLTERIVTLGYLDDRAFAEARARSMARRGLGARRVGEALRAAGVEEEDRAAIAPALDDGAAEAAVAFARRKRIGPFAAEMPERSVREKWMGAMLRAGHPPGLARALLRLEPGDDVDAWVNEHVMSHLG